MAAYTMAVMLAQVDVLTQANDNDIAEADREAAIRAALEHYSRDFPRQYAADYTGDGGRYYVLNDTALTDWADGFSRIVRIEYPAEAISDDGAPQYLDRTDWDQDYFVEEGTERARYLYLPSHSPASTEAMRITYTIPYTFTGSGAEEATDIPSQNFYAFCNLASAYTCRVIASKYSKIGDSTLTVDSASHTTKAQEFASRARELQTFYREQMALPDPGQGQGAEAAAATFVDIETAPSYSGRGWLYHSRR